MFCPKCKAEYREGFSSCADCNISLIPELPPEPPEEYVDWINIKTYSNRHEAELAKSFLLANGVNAVVSGDDYGGIHPALSFTTGIRLLVDKKDVEKAERILDKAG